MTSFRHRAAQLALLGLAGSATVIGGPSIAFGEPVPGFEQVELVTDFTTTPNDSEVRETVVVGTHAYVLQETLTGDDVLWEYDSGGGSIRVVDTTAFTSIQSVGVNYAGELVFSGLRPDGAGSEEAVLATLSPGGTPVVVHTASGVIQSLAAGSGGVYFVVDNALWGSDLTGPGTAELASGFSVILDLTPALLDNGTEVVYASANTGDGLEPHRYDPGFGLTDFDLRPGFVGSSPSAFHIIDGAAYFAAQTPTGTELFRIDGEDPATLQAESLQTGLYRAFGSGRRMYVSFDDGAGARQLAYIDHDKDTEVGVADDFQFVGGALAMENDSLLMALLSGSSGVPALWFTDGTEAGTVPVEADGLLDPVGSLSDGGVDASGAAAIFRADAGDGAQVWRFEPDEGAEPIDNDVFGDITNGIDHIVSPAAGEWIFHAGSPKDGVELYRSGGTTDSTELLEDLEPGNESTEAQRQSFVDAGFQFIDPRPSPEGDVVVSVDRDLAFSEVSLGLPDGSQVSALRRESDGSYSVFVQQGFDYRLFRSSGGVATELGDIGGATTSVFRVGNRLVGERSGFPSGRVMSIRDDGTDLQELGELGFSDAVAIDGGIVFRSKSTVDGGAEPWFTDGTIAGTLRLADIRSGSSGSSPSDFVVFGEHVYFRALSQVWRTDGTPDGTEAVWSELGVRGIGAVSDSGLLVNTTSGIGFVTSEAGDFTPVPEPDFPNAPLIRFFDQASGSSHPMTFVLDGGVTWLGVVRDGQLFATEVEVDNGDNIAEAVAHRGVAYFEVNREEDLDEIWRSDGTAEGTGVIWRQSDQAEFIDVLGLVGDRLLFDGWTPDVGEELRTVDLRPSAPTAVAATAGDATATISWTAPSDADSQPITGYRVTASPGGATCSTTGATTCEISGLDNGTAFSFTVVTLSGASVSAPSAASSSVTPLAPPPPFDDIETLVPARVLDTRSVGETVDDRFEKIGAVGAGEFVEIDIAGRAGVADDARSVVLNVTMIRPGGNGFATVYPCGDRPNASSMNAPNGGGVVANEVLAKLSSSGTVCLYSSVGTDLAADVTGYVPGLSGVVSLSPGRVLDTRSNGETVDDRFEKIGKLGAGEFVEIDIAGRAGMGDDARSVVLNVTMVRPDGNGFATVYPCGDRPNASSMNAPNGGGVVANEVIAKVSDAGTVCLFSSVGTDLAADVTGYVPSGSGVVSLAPGRVLDTRAVGETVDDRFEKGGKLAAGGEVVLDVLGRGGVPSSGVGSVVLNVTMVRPDGNGFATIYPCGDRPNASSMNAPNGGGVVANEVIAKVSDAGTVCLYTSVGTDLAADVTGYIATP